MNIEIIKSDKHELEIEIDNLTVAEVVRVYLNKAGIEFAAWKREHHSKPFVFYVKSEDKAVLKAISEAVAAIKKDCDALVSAVKK